MTWDVLQLFQLDSLLDEEELSLDIECPFTLKIIQKTHKKTNSLSQYILGTNYNWSEFTHTNGLKCLVKHIRYDSINQKDNIIINSNNYELLSVKQARILLSASRGVGFKEKGLFEQLSQVNSQNQNFLKNRYDKYGGAINLFNYMKNNKPFEKIDNKNEEYRKNINYGEEIIEHLSLIEVFEKSYSTDQKNQLLKSVIKTKMVNTISYDKNTLDEKLNYDDFPLETSKTEIEKGTLLLKTLKDQIVSPFTYFTYQIYENSKKCTSDINKLKTPCMSFSPFFDQENKSLAFDFLGEYRKLDLKNNIDKIVINATKDLLNDIGMDGKESGMIQPIIDNYDLPIKIKNNNLIFKNTEVCIKISLYVGYDVDGYSYIGSRECNGNIKVNKFIKVYAL